MFFLEAVARSFLEIVGESSFWLVFGFIFAGFVHEFVSPQQMMRHLGGSGTLSIVKASSIGMILPMCSCGVIPAGIGMRQSGAALGSTLAFMVATPIVNPAAIALCWGLLGHSFTLYYIAVGLVAAFTIGSLARFIDAGKSESQTGQPSATNTLSSSVEPAGVEPLQLIEVGSTSITDRVVSAFRWGFFKLGSDLSFYLLIGFILAAFLSALIPEPIIKAYLGNGNLTPFLTVTLIGIPLYVCAVGSIPFAATLITKGALPGIAIVFLMAGPATNVAELIAIYKKLGRKVAILFVTGMFVLSIAGGYLAGFIIHDVPVSIESIRAATQGLAESYLQSKYSRTSYNAVAMLLLLIIIAKGLYDRVLGLLRRTIIVANNGQP